MVNKILIIEDIPTNAKSLQKQIVDYIQVHKLDSQLQVIDEIGMNKEKARELLLKEKPDLVFLDIHLPNPNEGFQLLEEVGMFDFEFVITTGHDLNHYRKWGDDLSGIRFLVKPIEKEAITEVMERYLKACGHIDAKAHRKLLYTTFKHNQILKGQNQYLLMFSNRLRVPREDENKIHPHIPQESGRGYVSLQLKDIIYIQSNRDKLCFLFQEKGGLSVKGDWIYSSIEKIPSELFEQGFIRVHRSYVINERFVNRYIPPKQGESGGAGGSLDLLIELRVSIPVSNSYKHVVRKKWGK